MAIRVIDDSKLQSIAVAIQGKDGGGQMTVDEMPDRIDALPTGGTLIPKTITENGVYNAADDNADGYDVVTVDVPERNTLDELCADTLEVANIPSATAVPEYFFRNKSSLKNVIMPNVTFIGQHAFETCTNLALTSLPSGLTYIDGSAFENCTNLALTSLPSGLTRINGSAFKNCTNLALTSLPSGLTYIGGAAFETCTNLALTSLPSGLTWINGYAFKNCTNLALTSLPSGLTQINDSAFKNCTNLALTSLPSGLTYIDGSAFENCTNLALTSLPSGVTRIDSYAFQNCKNIPYLDFSNFTNIPALGSYAFRFTTFPFYFRDKQQLDEWAAATNWSTYADRFQIKPSGVI